VPLLKGVIGRLRRFLPVLPTTLANIEMGLANALRATAAQSGKSKGSVY